VPHGVERQLKSPKHESASTRVSETEKRLSAWARLVINAAFECGFAKDMHSSGVATTFATKSLEEGARKG
jgi:hypothetical protein